MAIDEMFAYAHVAWREYNAKWGGNSRPDSHALRIDAIVQNYKGIPSDYSEALNVLIAIRDLLSSTREC